MLILDLIFLHHPTLWLTIPVFHGSFLVRHFIVTGCLTGLADQNPVVSQSVGNRLPDHVTLHPRRLQVQYSSPQEPQIWLVKPCLPLFWHLTFLNHRFREKYIFHIPVLWVIALCAKVDVFEHYRGRYCLDIFSLKMEAVCYSETFVPTCKTLWCQTQEDHSMNLHCHENCKLKYFIVFRFFGIPMDLLPEIRSSSEIYGCLADGSLQGVPISGVTRSRCIEFVKVQITCLHKGWKTAEQVDWFLLSNGLHLCLDPLLWRVYFCGRFLICLMEMKQ